MAENSSKSVGLGGDGDEIVAIADVERAFGVRLDCAVAPRWVTAGDLFTSLQEALPIEERDSPNLWERFVEALTGQTGANPNEIELNSPLLSESRFWAHLADASAVVWIIAILGLLVVVAVAAF